MSSVVIYHKNCPDGLMAAAVCYRASSNNAIAVPAVYEKPLWDTVTREQVRGHVIYVVDFSFSPGETEALAAEAERVIVIDHHVTAIKHYGQWKPPENVSLILDKSRSGAFLTWEYFHPRSRVPEIIRHVDDYDRWVLAMPKSKAVHAYHRSLIPDVEIFASLLQATIDDEDGTVREAIYREGGAILRANDRQVEVLLHHPETVTFNGITALAVNSPSYQDDLGHALGDACTSGIGVVWYWQGNAYKVSLRSCPVEGRPAVNVSDIADKYGGGGHPCAASFCCKELPWKQQKTFQEMCLPGSK